MRNTELIRVPSVLLKPTSVSLNEMNVLFNAFILSFLMIFNNINFSYQHYN